MTWWHGALWRHWPILEVIGRPPNNIFYDSCMYMIRERPLSRALSLRGPAQERPKPRLRWSTRVNSSKRKDVWRSVKPTSSSICLASRNNILRTFWGNLHRDSIFNSSGLSVARSRGIQADHKLSEWLFYQVLFQHL